MKIYGMIKSKLTKEHLIKIIIENRNELYNINISPFTKLLRFDWYYESDIMKVIIYICILMVFVLNKNLK